MKKKKETDVAVTDNNEKSILKEQTSVKVVLNGGKYRLDDATIPFQIGFSKKIADREPTHILVVDVTEDVYNSNGSRRDNNYRAERSLFKLQPIHYLQLKSPGVHHLIFVLLNRVDNQYQQILLEKERASYRYCLYFSSIENKDLSGELGYFEAIVSVPEEFFATAPKTKLQKAIWGWTNNWYRFKPIDQCDYRKRKIVAFTIKPPLWFLGFLFRLICSVLLTSLSFIGRVVSSIAGYQPVSFFPNMKDMWLTFLLQDNKCYGEIFSPDYWIGDVMTSDSIDWSDCHNSTDIYPYKTLVLFGKKIHTPLSLAGLVVYPALFFVYYVGIVYGYFGPDYHSRWELFGFFVSLLVISCWITVNIATTIPTITSNLRWTAKWDKSTSEGKKRIARLSRWVMGILAGISTVSFLVVVIPWSITINAIIALIIAIVIVLSLILLVFFIGKILKALASFSKKLEGQSKANVGVKKQVKSQKQQWLETSFDINNMPPRIDFKALPEPSVASHKLVLTFWRTKARVCKPYAKS